MEEKNFISEVKSVASEFTAKERVAVVAGVLTFIMIAGIC
jgi:hypothetical protein